MKPIERTVLQKYEAAVRALKRAGYTLEMAEKMSDGDLLMVHQFGRQRLHDFRALSRKPCPHCGAPMLLENGFED